MSDSRNIKKQIGWIITFLGISIAIFALIAGLLGVDRDQGWGPARTFLFAAGLAFVIMPHFSWIGRMSGSIIRSILKSLGIMQEPGLFEIFTSKSTEDPEAKQKSSPVPGREKRIDLIIFIVLVIGIITYSWLVSVGRWTEWLGSTEYYHLLAEGFRSGKTSLAVSPPQELLDLPNPYEVEAREGLNYLWDVSLFDGNYYLYWGPTPALVALIIEAIFPITLTDGMLVWLFVLSCLVFLLLTLRFIWIKVLPEISWWTFVPVALLSPFLNPLPWLLTRPEVYEAAIASGQVFLLGGVYWFLTARHDRGAVAWRYFLAGVFWALAVGSRVTLAIPVILLFTILSSWLVYSRSKTKPDLMSWKQYFLFLLPLVVGAVLLALYNYERFGSILELGHRFQLGRTNKYDEYTGLLGILNIPQNFINYLVNPFRRISVFPYIKPTWGKYAIPQLRYSATDFYHTEQVTGALIAAPFLIFAFVPLFRWIRCKWKNLGEERIEAGCYLTERAALQEIYIWLSIAAMFSFSTLLLVGVNSMRHELDFVPLMFLLSVTGYISTYRLLPQSRWVKTLYLSGVWLLVITSAAFALLLAITGYNAAFENLNPDLFDWLVRFLTL